MRVLVTGAAGFIGTHVCNLLRERGHRVQGVDAYLTQVHGEKPHDVPPWIFASSVGNHALQWAKDSSECYDAVIHLAAEVGVGQSTYEPARYLNANVLETAKLWEAIMLRRSEVRRVVVASSMSVYGEGESYEHSNVFLRHRRVDRGWDEFDVESHGGNWAPNTSGEEKWQRYLQTHPEYVGVKPASGPIPTREYVPPRPASIYAQSKYDTERYSLLLGEAYDVPTIALRFFNVIGEGQALSNPYTGVAAGFACRMLNGEPALVFEDGQQSRDFVHVSDVARAVVNAATEAPDDLSGVFNVCTGKATTIEQVARMLGEAVCEANTERASYDWPPYRITGDYRVGDVRHCIGDNTAIKKALGWEPRVGLEEAIAKMVKWIIATDQHKQKPKDSAAQAMAEMSERNLLRKVGA